MSLITLGTLAFTAYYYYYYYHPGGGSVAASTTNPRRPIHAGAERAKASPLYG